MNHDVAHEKIAGSAELLIRCADRLHADGQFREAQLEHGTDEVVGYRSFFAMPTGYVEPTTH